MSSLLQALTYTATGVPGGWDGHARATVVVDQHKARQALALAWPLATRHGSTPQLRLLAARAPLCHLLRDLVTACKEPAVRADFLSRDDLGEEELRQWLSRERNQQVLAAIVSSAAGTPTLRASALATGKLAPARAAVELLAAVPAVEREALLSRQVALSALGVCADAYLKVPQAAQAAMVDVAKGMSLEEFETFARTHPGPVAVSALAEGEFTPDQVADDVLLCVAREATDAMRAWPGRGTSRLRHQSALAVRAMTGAASLPQEVVELLDARLGKNDYERVELARHLLPPSQAGNVLAVRKVSNHVAQAAKGATSGAELAALWATVPAGADGPAVAAAAAVLSNSNCPVEVALDALTRYPNAARGIRPAVHLLREPKVAAAVLTELGTKGVEALVDHRLDHDQRSAVVRELLASCLAIWNDPGSTDQLRKVAWNVASRTGRSPMMTSQLVGALPMGVAVALNVPLVLDEVGQRTLDLLEQAPVRVEVLEALAGQFSGSVDEYFTAAVAAAAVA